MTKRITFLISVCLHHHHHQSLDRRLLRPMPKTPAGRQGSVSGRARIRARLADS